MNNDLKTLIDLQALDVVIDACKEDLEKIPLAMEEKRALINSCKDSVEQAKKNLTDLLLKKKEKELEVGGLEEKARKSEKDLNSIKSNEAYRALLSEIDASKKFKSDAEEEILNIMVEVDKANLEIKNQEARAKGEQQNIETEIKILEEEMAKAKEKLDAEMKKREEFAAGIPKPVLARYNYIKERKKSTAIASIVRDACTGCNNMLTQNVINEVKKGKELVLCESCSRILYCPE